MGKKLFTLALALCLLSGAAYSAAEDAAPAADVRPLPMDPEEADLVNGSFKARLEDEDRADEGWFTLQLYLADEYDPEQIMNLKPGDTVLVNGEIYTVKEMGSRDIGWFDEEDIVWEIETEEECWGGLLFRKYGKDTFAAYLDDWVPCTFVATVKVTLPLPGEFEMIAIPGGEEPETLTQEEFLVSLREDDWGIYNEYNTSASFTDGRLVRIQRSGYPHGPRDPEEEDDC